MAERFDAKTYVPDQASSGLSGAIMFHRLDFARFEQLLSAADLASLRPKAKALAIAKGGNAFPDPSARIADDASWWRWLVLDACVAKYGSGGAVLEAIGSN